MVLLYYIICIYYIMILFVTKEADLYILGNWTLETAALQWSDGSTPSPDQSEQNEDWRYFVEYVVKM